MAGWIKEGILFFLGLCSGGIVAAGLFSFIISIGALSRVVGKMHAGDHVRLFENFVVAGVTLGNLVNLYEPELYGWFPGWTGAALMAIFGLFAGVFVGVLIMSQAENLNALPVFARNFHMTEGMKYIVFSIAAGKGVGAWMDVWIG